MKRMILPAISLIATICLATAIWAGQDSARVEVTQVRNIGVSAANDSRSIIEVRWTATAAPGTTLKSFEIILEVFYADGTGEKARTSVEGKARSARFEVPTLHTAPGRPASEMKRFKVVITTTLSETSTKQGDF